MRRTLVLAALAGGLTAAVVACTLNPQPLPPSDFASADDNDASTRADGGSLGGETPAPSADASADPADRDGGHQADCDGGDASTDGDACDASTDGG